MPPGFEVNCPSITKNRAKLVNILFLKDLFFEHPFNKLQIKYFCIIFKQQVNYKIDRPFYY